MNQDGLANEAGILQKALSKIENDEVEPRVSACAVERGRNFALSLSKRPVHFHER